MDLNETCKFIEVGNVESFDDYDIMMGLDCCVHVEGGIVVSTDMFKEYTTIVENWKEWDAS